MKELTEQQKKNVQKIISLLDSSSDTFYWIETPQGYNYWNDVFDNLKQIQNYKDKVCPHCGQKIKSDEEKESKPSEGKQ
jgi:hypothetical protein